MIPFFYLSSIFLYEQEVFSYMFRLFGSTCDIIFVIVLNHKNNLFNNTEFLIYSSSISSYQR